MDDTQRIVKCGNLSLHSPGSFFKKRWHSKYLVLYDGSKSGVKRLELFDSEIKFKKQNPSKIIPLVDCVRVVTCQRQKTTYTFEVRTSDQFYLLAAQSFQDMNDWVNCLRLVAFGQSTSQSAVFSPAHKRLSAVHSSNSNNNPPSRGIDILLEKRNLPGAPVTSRLNTNSNNAAAAAAAATTTTTTDTAKPLHNQHVDLGKVAQQEQQTQQQAILIPPSLASGDLGVSTKNVSQAPATDIAKSTAQPAGAAGKQHCRLVTASQAASAAASALSKTRQRQPSLLGSCKPQPPTDSPFIQAAVNLRAPSLSASVSQLDTLTPTVRGQLIAAASRLATVNHPAQVVGKSTVNSSENKAKFSVQATLDEEEENMLYCSIEDNPSEHNYRVKVIETELSLRCQLKCYQLTASTTINQQYEQLGQFSKLSSPLVDGSNKQHNLHQSVTFYQLIIGPQELTLLNDYASSIHRVQANLQQQGLWSWPYQCIRRYGFDKDNCFMFEAGRKCTSGPGQFIVQTPKAYSIYQDVVKFVNELRSLSVSTASGPIDEAPMQPPDQRPISDLTGTTNSQAATNSNKMPSSQPAVSQQDEKQQQAVVTQIPVMWTPISGLSGQQPHTTSDKATCVTTTTDSVHSRRQFFDTLRQLNNPDNSSVQHQLHTTANSSESASGKNGLSEACDTSGKINNDTSSSNRSPTGSPTSTTTSPDDSHPIHQVSCSGSSSDKNLIDSPTSNLLSESNKCAERIASRSEETDESGYEQGDESVTSSKSSSRSKLTSLGSRKRQVNESMSSASSTSSGGGSPGHSVSRRSNGAINSGPLNPQTGASAGSPLKRLSCLSSQNSTSCPSVSASPPDKHQQLQSTSKLGIILNTLADQSEDFDASLIRDVYSEITKLHAKFAVTRGSGEDSDLSSNSSNEGSAERSETNDDHNGLDDDHNQSSPINHNNHQSEPMYSNLSLNESRISRARLASLDLHRTDELECHPYRTSMQNSQQQRTNDIKADTSGSHMNRSLMHHTQNTKPQQHYSTGLHQSSDGNCPTSNLYSLQGSKNSYSATHNSSPDYLSLPRCGPMYPSVLNPIPECGEVTAQQPMPKQPTAIINSQKSVQMRPIRNTKTTNNESIIGKRVSAMRANFDRTYSAAQKPVGYHQRDSAESSLVRKKSTNPKQTSQIQQQVMQKGLHPTNHYVINDVQYAKISRNVCSSYEACL